MRISEHRRARTARDLGTLALVGVLAGVILAAAAFPLVAASGLAAKASAESFDRLPAEFTVTQAPQATQVYAADGRTLLATFFDENRRDVKLADVAPAMAQALVAAEDQNFYHHNGVDVGGLVRAVVVNKTTGSQQGGSTLTMQLTRMLATYSATDPQAVIDATEKTPGRKIKESKVAIALDRKLGKDGVLERYLNLAPFGRGTYGVYAAARFYFGKAPKDLDLAESALLAAVIRAPGEYDPIDPTTRQAALDRRAWVLDQMVATKAITAERGDRGQGGAAHAGRPGAAQRLRGGQAQRLGLLLRLLPPLVAGPGRVRPHRVRPGAPPRGRRLPGGDQPRPEGAGRPRRRTCWSRSAPATATRCRWRRSSPAPVGCGRSPSTARTASTIRATRRTSRTATRSRRAAGARGSYPVTSNPLITGGGGVAGYQAGSTFKIFTVVAALEKGYPIAYPIDAPKIYRSGFPAPQGQPGSCSDIPRYCPGNDSPGMEGPADMWSAFGRSVNTYFVPLEERVGVPAVVDAASRMGIRFLSPQDAERAADPQQSATWGAFTLGVSAVTPLDLANAYATLAADGMHCAPTPVQQIVDAKGQQLDVAKPRCDRALEPEVARAALDVARCPVGDQSAFGRCGGATARAAGSANDHPIAGKTGTTDSHRTASLVVTTRQLSVAGILADPDWPETTANMDHGIVNPAVYQALADAMKGKPKQAFPEPTRKTAYGEQKRIPDVTCSSQAAATAELKAAGFTVTVAPDPVPSPCPAGAVAGTEPGGQTVVGGSVRLRLSSGAPVTAATPTPPTPR